jgi:putative NADPH-quinone reductase
MKRSMSKRIAIIQGHPDSHHRHFGHALAGAYASGAVTGNQAVQHIDVATLGFPLLQTKEDFEHASPPDSIRAAQETIRWADHLVILYPLWHGSMPALLKGFFEQVFRPGFALAYSQSGRMPKKLLTGKSARIVVTMGMPAVIYRWYYLAHSVKSLERNLLGVAGIGPIRESLIGMVEGMNDKQRSAWLEKMTTFGAQGR